MTKARLPQQRRQAPESKAEGTAGDVVSVTPRAMRGIAIGLLLVIPLWLGLGVLVYALIRLWS